MFIKKSYEDENTVQSKYDIGDDDEEEETLSFYEFSINSDADAWEDSSRSESKNSSFKSSEEEEEEEGYFEFFSEELKMNSTTSYQPENIIFCGKIIPHKQPISEISPKSVVKEKNHRRRGLFRRRWNFFTSSYKSRTSRKNDSLEPKNPCTTSNAKKELQPGSPKHKCSTRKRSKLHGFQYKKMSIFTSPSKSRWYLYLFGISRFRTEIGLRDMKNRQSRRSPSCSLFRLESSDDQKKKECKGAWGLLRALSCGGGDHLAKSVVQATVGRSPHV